MKRMAFVVLFAVCVVGLAPVVRDGKEFTDWSPAVNLGPTVNSSANDSCVSISKDGLTLFFSSVRGNTAPMNRDLYVTTRPTKDAAWGAPDRLDMLNTGGFDSCPALSLDEHRLYFTSDREPSCGGIDLWVVRRQDRRDNFGWEGPENLGCEPDGYVNTPGWDVTPTFFEDEEGNEVMYFASTREAGVATTLAHHYESVMRRDGTFGPGVPVYELNSANPYGDLGITVRRDGLEVFFLSTRPYGGAGMPWNFWRATRTSTREAWSEPSFVPELGNPAYGNGRITLSFDGSELYFASGRAGGLGGPNDLYVARRDQSRGPEGR